MNPLAHRLLDALQRADEPSRWDCSRVWMALSLRLPELASAAHGPDREPPRVWTEPGRSGWVVRKHASGSAR